MRIRDWSSDVCSSDLALLEPWQVHLAALGAVEDVPLPQQGVAVQVDDRQRPVQRLGAFADGRQRFAVDRVHPALDDTGGEGEESERGDRDDEQDTENTATHRLCRSEEHTSELQSLMRNSFAVFCLKKKRQT